MGFTEQEALNDTSTTKGELTDTYPAKKVDLSVSKTVSGYQGSKDQYFKFTINLTTPTTSTTRTCRISGADTTVPQTAYNSSTTNPGSVTLPTTGSIDVWLKHGQTVKIEGLPYGTAYSIAPDAGETDGCICQRKRVMTP